MLRLEIVCDIFVVRLFSRVGFLRPHVSARPNFLTNIPCVCEVRSAACDHSSAGVMKCLGDSYVGGIPDE